MRKTLKIIGWVAGGILGLGIAIYLTAVAINWRDREPSATAIRFTNLYRQRPVVADEENAYIYLMGFAVAPGESPLQVGSKRVAWMQKSAPAPRLNTADDPVRERFDYKAQRRPVIQEFVDACKPVSADCAAAFAAGDAVFKQWTASESWLLDRYRALIAYPGWQESVPFDVAAPLPSYALVMDGQKFLLLNAKILVERGDSVGASRLLGEDLRFWRMVLESSDILISKMIATAAIDRHFELGSLIFRAGQPGTVMGAVPANWSIALSESERSMRRCFVGEWMFMSAELRNTEHADFYGLNDNSLVAGALSGLIAPLYQPQDTMNKRAEYLSVTAELLSVPIERYAGAVTRTREFSRRTVSEVLPPRSAYNIVGRMLLAVGAYDFGTYARRVADLEGVRRAALLAVTLRAANIGVPEVAAALTSAALRDPYNNRPFEWDEKGRAIVFRGLEVGERGEHRIQY
jgi:hypothetical protein